MRPPWEEPEGSCTCVWDEDDPSHDLVFPDCPQHGHTDPPGPPPSPTAVTVWCGECEGPSDVEEDWHEETGPLGMEYRVRRLGCGHEEAHPASRAGRPSPEHMPFRWPHGHMM